MHFIHECNVQITWQLAARLYTKWISFKIHVDQKIKTLSEGGNYIYNFEEVLKNLSHTYVEVLQPTRHQRLLLCNKGPNHAISQLAFKCIT